MIGKSFCGKLVLANKSSSRMGRVKPANIEDSLWERSTKEINAVLGEQEVDELGAWRNYIW